jgi:thiol-disulfide isomerase/thioredoxin
MKFPERLKRYRPDWLTLVLLGLIAYMWFRPPAWVSDLDRPAPQLQVVTFDGQPLSLDALRGKVVVVNFWATWCPYCRHEMPAMEKFYRDYRDRGVEIVALSEDDDPVKVREFLQQEGYAFKVAMAGRAGSDFGGVDRLPTSFVIDKRGHIRSKVSGQVHYGRLEDLVVPLLKE